MYSRDDPGILFLSTYLPKIKTSTCTQMFMEALVIIEAKTGNIPKSINR